jgi:hypothetical protein
MAMYQYHPPNLTYLFSIIERCRCGTEEEKNPNHSRCQIIKQQMNPNGTRNFDGFREFRFFKDGPIIYKILKIHCDECPIYHTPYFEQQFDEGIYYPVGTDEYGELVRLRSAH